MSNAPADLLTMCNSSEPLHARVQRTTMCNSAGDLLTMSNTPADLLTMCSSPEPLHARVQRTTMCNSAGDLLTTSNTPADLLAMCSSPEPLHARVQRTTMCNSAGDLLTVAILRQTCSPCAVVRNHCTLECNGGDSLLCAEFLPPRRRSAPLPLHYSEVSLSVVMT